MSNAKEALFPTIIGVMFSFVTLVLLIASQIKQTWILYKFVISGSVQAVYLGNPVTVTYTFTTTADIGIWNYDFSTISAYSNQIPGIAEDGTITGTEDSATSGYFSEAAVKACRALAILATISTLINIISSIGTYILSMKTTGNVLRLFKLYTITISTAGFTVFTATLALIVVRTQFKDGMSIDTSFYIAIAANITSAIALVMYSITYVFLYKYRGSSITQVLPVEDVGTST
ncbi:uncharacterized protein [Mytilus edulis]|uniref:uncharacterized protein n=1 Tax=Mytilus edulis TaxID=6550 RepID=UPI0039F0B5DE